MDIHSSSSTSRCIYTQGIGMEPINENTLIGVCVISFLYIPVSISLFKEIKNKRKEGIVFDVFMLLLITANIIYFITMQD